MRHETPAWARELVDAEDAAKQAEGIIAEGHRLLRSAHERGRVAHNAAKDWQNSLKQQARKERDGDSFLPASDNAVRDHRV